MKPRALESQMPSIQRSDPVGVQGPAAQLHAFLPLLAVLLLLLSAGGPLASHVSTPPHEPLEAPTLHADPSGAPAVVAPVRGTGHPGASHPAVNATSGCDGYYWNQSLNVSYNWGCYGHDEPTFTYWSGAPHSGEDASFTTVLPFDGSISGQSDVSATFWYGGVVYDPNSLNQQAFLEFQFYPLQPVATAGSSDCDSQGNYYGNFGIGLNDWFACVVVWQVVGNNENAADAGPFDLLGTSNIMEMHSGDHLVVNYSGVAKSSTGWTLSVSDLTSRAQGSFTLNGGAGDPLSPYWSVADGGIGWGADTVSAIDFAYEIGHANDPAITQAGAFGACYPGNPPTSDGTTPGACPSYTPADWQNNGWMQLGLPQLGAPGSREYPYKIGFTSSMGSTGFINTTTCHTPSNTTACLYPWYSYESNNYSFNYGMSTLYSNYSYGYLDQFPSFNGTQTCASNVNGTNTPAVCPTKNWAAPWANVTVTPTPSTAVVTASPGPINQTGGAYVSGAISTEMVQGWYWINATLSGCTPYSQRWYFVEGQSYNVAAPLTCAGAVAIQFQISPVGGGTIVFGGQTFYSGESTSVVPGTYTLGSTSNPGFHGPSWTGTTGITPQPLSGTVQVSAAGTLTLALLSWVDVMLEVNPASCGPATVNGTTLASGGSDSTLPAGAGGIAVSIASCAGMSFLGWALTSGTLASPTALSTTMSANGNGTLYANFTSLVLYAVTISVVPASCGPLQLNGTSEASGSTAQLAAGVYPLVVPSCAGQAPRPSFQITGGVALNAANTQVSVSGAGGLSVTYVPVLTGSLTGPLTGNTGQTLTFSLAVSGGLAPVYTVWSFGDGSSPQNLSGSRTASHAFPSAGTYGVTAWVNDSDGQSIALSASVKINATTSGTPASAPGGLPLWTYLAIGGLAVLALVAVLAVALHRRRKRSAPPPPNPYAYPNTYAPPPGGL